MNLFSTPILHKVLIRAPREKVFDAMTTAEGLDGWFTKGAEVDLRPGGHITFRWVDWGPDKINSESVTPIIEVKRPERLVFQWWTDHYTTVEMDFEEVEAGTVISVRNMAMLTLKRDIDVVWNAQLAGERPSH